MRATLCGVALEKYEWMSALPIAKVKVAARKNSPTRTAVFLVDAAVGSRPFIAVGISSVRLVMLTAPLLWVTYVVSSICLQRKVVK